MSWPEARGRRAAAASPHIVLVAGVPARRVGDIIILAVQVDGLVLGGAWFRAVSRQRDDDAGGEAGVRGNSRASLARSAPLLWKTAAMVAGKARSAASNTMLWKTWYA